MSEITIRDRKITIKELTVRQVRAWFAELDSKEVGERFDLVNDTLFEEFSLADIPMMTDLKPDDLEDLTPTELAQVLEKIKEVNSHFFGQRRRLARAGAKAVENAGAP